MGQEISKKIENLAFELGFSQCSFTALEKNSPGFQYFQKWIQAGYQGEMSYLERGGEKRQNPELVLEGAKSIICLAWDYSSLAKFDGSMVRQFDSRVESPFISRYAWGEDYHELLGEKLKTLQQQLQLTFPLSHFKSYVDSGPVMEKYWAEQAALGWIGKHTNLIYPKEGSYFFLASILTDLDLNSSSQKISNHCGKCQACIEICPTQAIVAPYVLDARRCISYLTIELKGPIPLEFRSQIGHHVFGCDDCQEVCPWNRKAKLPLDFLRSASVEELHFYLSLDGQAFKKYFKNTPMLRAKRRGFLRNVCVVLGNMKQPESLPYLTQALEDSEPLVRGHAAWALGQYSEMKVYSLLEKTLQKEEDLWVRSEISLLLNRLLS